MFGKSKTEVIVVGAGPVGLYTSITLRERNVEIEVYDQDARMAARSYALALHPQSLRLLDEIGLAQKLTSVGRRLDRIALYDGSRRRAEIYYGDIGGPFSYLLVVPQNTLEALLHERLERARKRVHWSHRVQQLEMEDHQVAAVVHKLDRVSLGYPISSAEYTITKSSLVEAQFVVGADGYESRVRNIADIDYESYGEAGTFYVTEFDADRVIEPELRIILEGPWANVCWPISEHRVRWSFQIDPREMETADPSALVRFLEDRAPWFHARPRETHWTTLARFEKRLATRFGKHRMWLAGDAAHLTSPIGVQSVNVGLREGHDLAARIANAVRNGDEESLADYEVQRLAEWRVLLGLSERLEGLPGVDPWVEEHRARILPCLPACGPDLDVLLKQIKLERRSEPGYAPGW